ncbi:MAG TPA: ABC transporter ATP-binding protein [Bacteroidales bacterium]|nr:ABC transporter ATP-binding protein [Bacteroidales bacterium]HPS71582.1 ABC transporter ATP-binding protein [Bacteroidales bacterium]
MKIVEVQNVTKKYANHLALDSISLSVEKGSVFGLLGPNGAGKTTLIRILNQITAPDSGVVLFQGRPIQKDDVEKIGYLPEERGLYKKMKVGEQALYLAQLKGLSKQVAMERLVSWFRKFEIESWWNRKVEELSKGMQQKVQFVTTIIHEPDFLILDEPFSGFDPINTNILKEEIINLRKKGTTIILSTHDMASVEEICDDIVLINKAKKVLEGNLVALKQQFKNHQFEIVIESDSDPKTYFQNSDQFSLIDVIQKNNQYHLSVQLHEQISSNQLLQNILPFGNLVTFKEILPNMNEIFIKQVNDTK